MIQTSKAIEPLAQVVGRVARGYMQFYDCTVNKGQQRSMKLSVCDFQPIYQDRAAELVNEGLGARFGFIDHTKNPDLYDIAATYRDDCFLVALLHGEVIGTGGLIYESQFVARIVRMHTASACRRRGVALSVLQELERRALNYGAREIILDTDIDWHDAHGFYSAAGFSEFRRNELGIRFHKLIHQEP